MNQNLNLRKLLLEQIASLPKNSSLQTNSIIQPVAQKIGRGTKLEQALLTAWQDLFRLGYVSWGCDLANPNPPFFHLSDIGRKTLENLSRDPSNPDGYLASLTSFIKNPICESYVHEALSTYNSNCFRASSVMIGAAAESLLLELRDTFIAKIGEIGESPSKNLIDWRIRRITIGLEDEINKRRNTLEQESAERYEAYWNSFISHIRLARNESGHPTSIEQLSTDVAHGNLLIFPELAKLIFHLSNWAKIGFKKSQDQSQK